MGCDIHCFLEVICKGKNSGSEYIYCFAPNIDLGRNYVLFGLMAGVRGSNQLFEKRGIPNNASSDYKAAVKQLGSDGHSHSYLSLKELWKVLDEYERTQGITYSPLRAIMAMMDETETDESIETRLCFFFDN